VPDIDDPAVHGGRVARGGHPAGVEPAAHEEDDNEPGQPSPHRSILVERVQKRIVMFEVSTGIQGVAMMGQAPGTGANTALGSYSPASLGSASWSVLFSFVVFSTYCTSSSISIVPFRTPSKNPSACPAKAVLTA